MGADAEDIGLTIHPHPTLSETIAFAAEVAEGTITDLPNKKAPPDEVIPRHAARVTGRARPLPSAGWTGCAAAMAPRRRRRARTDFEPMLREGGGHAVVYDDRSVVVEEVTRERRDRHRHPGALRQGTAGIVDALRSLGLDPEVGELPGEYCAGAHSVTSTGSRSPARPSASSAALRSSPRSSSSAAATDPRGTHRHLRGAGARLGAVDRRRDPGCRARHHARSGRASAPRGVIAAKCRLASVTDYGHDLRFGVFITPNAEPAHDVLGSRSSPSASTSTSSLPGPPVPARVSSTRGRCWRWSRRRPTSDLPGAQRREPAAAAAGGARGQRREPRHPQRGPRASSASAPARSGTRSKRWAARGARRARASTR